MFIIRVGDHLCWGCTVPEPDGKKEDWRKATKPEGEEMMKTLPQRKWR